MGQRFKNHCTLALFSLMFFTVVRGARDILTETCEDRHGADLNENIALNKPATQSSTSNGGVAGRLVDGNHNPYFGNDSCSETDAGSSSWEVDLGAKFYVTSVTITTRADDHWREVNMFSITVENSLCSSGMFVHDGQTTTYLCEKVEKGMRVQITVTGTETRLSLCEVEVHGYPFNFYENEVNYALLQPAKMSSLHNQHFASHAVDGVRSTRMSSGSCIHNWNFFGWWTVDLGTFVDVYAVVLTNRGDGIATRLNEFDIRIGDNWHPSRNPTCSSNQSIESGETRAIFCSRPMRGNNVGIAQKTRKILNFCEVSVHGRDVQSINSNEPACLTPGPLGMEDNTILASQLLASSQANNPLCAVEKSRLNELGESAWCAFGTDSNPWMQVGFLWPAAVTEILTQGRNVKVNWVTKFKFSSSNDFVRYESYKSSTGSTEFQGNSDQNTIVSHPLRPVRVVRIIRIHIVEHHNWPSMRVEFVGCYYKDKGFPLPRALGMQSKEITDNLITASSQYGPGQYEPQNARLWGSRAWSTANADSDPWIQINFVLTVTILEILTQGRQGTNQWVKNYKVAFAQETNSFEFYRDDNGDEKLFPGNANRNTVVRNALSPAIRAQFLRVYPKEYNGHRSMRLEIVGYYEDQKVGALGLEDNRIQNAQLSSSSERDGDYGPQDGRLHNPRAWRPLNHYLNWLQVDFWRRVKVTEILTQGRSDSDPEEWYTSYYIDYSLNAVNFIDYAPYGTDEHIFSNTDGHSVFRKLILPAIEARVVRITGYFYSTSMALRMEVVGYYITCAVSCYARPLGMESGEISDTQITASSVWVGYTQAGGARLNFLSMYNTRRIWVAKQNDRLAWIQVAFHQIAVIIEVQTQGRSENQMFYNYTLSYGNNGVDFETYEQDDAIKIFQGNTDAGTIVSHSLWPVITTRFIRITAVSCGSHCAVRAEFIGSYEGDAPWINDVLDPPATHGPALIDPEFVEFENTLTASSSMDWNHRPHLGIISNHFNPRAWSPLRKKGEYIQVDLLQLTVISGVGLRLAGDKIHDHFTKLVLWYGDTEKFLKFLRDRTGNMTLLDTNVCYTELEKPLLARYVRLSIDSWEIRPDFRFQLYGTTVNTEATAGVEFGSIKDDQMKSSNHPNDPYPAYDGRLNGPRAWCGNPSRKKLYLQIDFLWNFEVHGVATQGKQVDVMEYVTEYKLSSTMDGIIWNLYKENQIVKIFPGNTNCDCIRKNLVQPFLARAVRFLPIAWKDTPCLRTEIYGVYKGILRIHARSGILKGPNETVVKKKCFIKLNGQEVSRKMPGYNVVVANQTTGALISSRSANNSAGVNDLLMNIPSDSIVIVATQNVTKRPSDETLNLLESLGAISLRYFQWSQNLLFLLVGYKGEKRVNWIKEKLGTFKDDIIRIAVPVKLNENEIKPTINEYFVSLNNTNDSVVTLSGDNAYVSRSMTGRCSEDSVECEMGLSLSMWMKPEPLDIVENVEPAPTSERFELQYYFKGYIYIVNRDAKMWVDAHRYCLGIGATLPIYHDLQTRDYVFALMSRVGFSTVHVGLSLNPRTMTFTEWMDGSPITSKWNGGEPSGLPEGCITQTSIHLNDIPCDDLQFKKPVICQQPVEALLGNDVFPLGLESMLIPNTSIEVSDVHDATLAPGHHARLNQNVFGWCAPEDVDDPFIQVDLGRLTRICAVATQGRGVDLTHVQYPKSFWVEFSNDSVNWEILFHHDKKKYFRGNHDSFGVVINRFPQPEFSQIVRIHIEEYEGAKLCMRMELFGCRTVEHTSEDAVDPPLPPKSITESTPKTCLDVLMSGKTSSAVYMIDPDGRGAFPAFCDQETDDGGWIVFQRRFDGSIDFNKTWDEYKWGFGERYREHWLGLEYMSRLTHANVMDMRVDLEDFYGNQKFCVFNHFQVGDEENQYRSDYGSGSYGTVLSSMQRTRFSTKYRRTGDKPIIHQGAWWYGSAFSNLNGKYFDHEVNGDESIFWKSFKQKKGLKSTKLMIRQGMPDPGSALGLQNEFIQDYQLTATGFINGNKPTHARLNQNSFWEIRSGNSHYLIVNMISVRRITHISTQGGSNTDYVTTFSVRFKNLDGTIVEYEENGKKRVFEANHHETVTNVDAIRSNCFNEPVKTTEIQVYPETCRYEGCSLRMELYACDDPCSTPVGIQSDFPVDRILTSTSASSLDNLRLFSSSAPWLANHDNKHDSRYVEVKLFELFRVTAIATQGGVDDTGSGRCFVRSYYLMYVNNRMKWVSYGGRKPKILPGNTNSRAVAKTKLETPFLAHIVRLVGNTYQNKMCLKLEVYGCYPDNPSFTLFTENVKPGKEMELKGRYRYCPKCECPDCIKSLCVRVFDHKYLLASYFAYDCVYHDFEITVHASVVPGRHKVYLIESEYRDCHTDEHEQGSSEKVVGSINVKKEPSSCLEILFSGNTESGIYNIDPDGQGYFKVYCDQSLYGGGWTVIQTRASTDENFDRTWQEYKVGFGELEQDFWLGNKFIHRLTTRKQELSLELKSSQDVTFVQYESFQISDRFDNFRLHIAEYVPSPGGNCLEDSNGIQFTTHDRDNDEDANVNCAHGSVSGFGWWFRSCTSCQLNGSPQSGIAAGKQLKYSTWANQGTLQHAKMKVRDRKTVFCNDHYCYYMLKTWNNWLEASQHCKRFHSDLVSIHNAVENEWIRSEILVNLDIDKIHIGLKNGTWTDGSASDFHNFSSDVPNDLCPVLDRAGSWQYQDCRLKSRILCKRSKWCFKGKCHVFGYDKVNLSNIKKHCDDIGYKLPKIRSEDEKNYLKHINLASTDSSAWREVFLGLTLDSLRHPYWYDGKKVRYADWKDGEPDENHKSCAQLWSLGWTDASCNDKWLKYPLCEKIYKEHPLDCLDLLLSGVTSSGIYTIDPDGLGPIKVYCDQETFGGGWTVLLKRGSPMNFNRVWENYKTGFGYFGTNFWLGNDNIHRLTKFKQEVLFDLESENGENGFALYKTFKVADEEDKYRLTIGGYQTSTVGDAMGEHNSTEFSTKDQDNDANPSASCGADNKAGWWFNDCSSACLTCRWGQLTWLTWTSNHKIGRVEVKIRSSSAVSCDDKFCYYLSYGKKSWNDALQDCRNFNADLVSIHSEVQMDFILENVIVPQALESVHLGLNASNSWTDGSRITLNKLPSALGDTECSSLLPSGDWIANDCNEKKAVLCKRAKHCYKGDCYFIHDTPMVGSVVVSFCQESGYEAVKISSHDEKDYLLKLVRDSTPDGSVPWVLLGHVLSSDEDRVWRDGTLLKYDDWTGTEPNGIPSGELYSAFDAVGTYDVPGGYSYRPGCEKAPIIRNCNEVKRKYDRSDSGVYAYNGKNQKTFPVYCELNTKDGSWLVFQRRVRQTTLTTDFSFYSWTAYKDGFGTKESNYWLGNKYIHELTWNNPHRLKIVIHTSDFHIYEAIYEDFYLGPESSGFVINFGVYSGNAGDALSKHRGMSFSARDDDRTVSGCTTTHQGGWWFENCLDSNLNGVFTSPSNSETTIFWRTIKEDIIRTEMKIQPYPIGSRANQTTTSLTLTSIRDWMEIDLQTASQHWITRVPHPDPFITHVSVTWEESSYLRYYENGTLVSAVPAINYERPEYPDTSPSVFVDLPYLWLHQMKLWAKPLTPLNAYRQYASTEITFDDQGELTWTINKTSNYNWELQQNCTPSYETGPCGDHTFNRNTGTFIIAEASRPASVSDVAVLESPTFLDHYKCLSFWYHLFGRKMGSMKVYAEQNTMVRVFLAEISGDIGNQWRSMQVGLSITGVFKIILEAKRGEGSQSDIAIDDISLSKENCIFECYPECEAGRKCNPSSLQCVHEGIYDHLWTMDILPPTDEKNIILPDYSLKYSPMAGVIDKAIRYTDGSSNLGSISDQCYDEICFAKYTLSFWLLYEETTNTYQSLVSFRDRLLIEQYSTVPKNLLNVQTFVTNRKCLFQVFAPAEIWTHFIFVVNEENFTLYKNGREVKNTTLVCSLYSSWPEPTIDILVGERDISSSTTGTNFGVDDLRLLLDVLTVQDTLDNYRTITGYDQTIWFKAKLTTITWQQELMNDESDIFRSLSQRISDEIMSTLGEISFIKTVYVLKFIQEVSTIVEIDIVYQNVSYYDILLLAEAIYVNKTFDGLQVDGLEIDSYSVPNYCPENLTVVALNESSLAISWLPVDTTYINGVFQGYKIIYQKTNGSRYAEYISMPVYANYTEEIINGLDRMTNYAVRILAFSLSGDGLPSDPVVALTLDGEVTESPNMTVVNISSTALYVNWTMLPLSTDEYQQLLGYKFFYWKESDESQVFNETLSPNENNKLFEDLEKWTVYCFKLAGFTLGGAGPNATQCARTFEDAPEHPPNVSATQVTTSSIQLEWLPLLHVPGIVRYYNISYRVLNISDTEVVEMAVPSGSTSYLIDGLTGLMLCEINVTAVTVKAGPSKMIKVLTNEGVPLAAPNISLLNMSSTSFDVNWTEIPWELHNGILLGYKICIETKGRIGLSTVPCISIQTFSPNEFYKHMMNMSKWTTYCVKICGFTAVGDGARSPEECTRTYEDAPEETPSNFTAIDVNVNSIKVQWDPPPITSVPGIIRSYNLTYRNLNYTNENLTTAEVGGSEDLLVLEKLHGLTLYEVNITAVTILPGPWKVLFVLTQEGVPAVPPPNVMWFNLSSTSLKTTWEPIPPHLCNGMVMGYNVFFWKHSDSQSVSNVTVSEEVTLLEELEKWTIYCGQVEAFTTIGEGPRSQVECIRTFEDEPEVAPAGLNGTNTTWTSFYLSWESIDPGFIPGILRSYRVSYEIQDPGFNQAYDGDILVDGQDISVNLTGLIGLTNYKITVRGVTVKDGPGVEVYLKTKEGVPTSPPEEIVPADITPTTITLSWKDIFLPERHGIIRGYQVTYKKLERRSKREAEEKTVKFGADVRTAFMFKLDPYTNYSITVAGYTSQGLGVKKHFIIETKQGAPGVAPKNSYGLNFTGPTSITIGWGSLTTAELQGILAGFEVRYRKFSVADEIIPDPAPEISKVIYADVNGVKLTGLETYTTYQVRVAAISGGGLGTFSPTLYLATCRCQKTLTTNYWNLEPYTNISRKNSIGGFFPYLLDMVTLYCCQHCLEHGTSEVDYFRDGLGKSPERDSDISVKRNLTLETDFSFPVYGYNGQSTYMRYFGYAPIVEIVGTVFFTLKPEYSLIQGNVLMASVLSIVPFVAIAVIFAYIAGVLMWALENGDNEDEFPSRFFKGAANGFWWAYITMTTVGYGDKTARTVAGRVFAVIWVLTGLCICSLLIGTIATAFTTSSTPPDPEDIIIYGSKVAALQDSPDHKLGLRRNAKVNPDNKTYHTLEELQKVLLSETVDGILIDAYVADARKDLFSQFQVTKIIDLSSSYGVVMGTDAKKIRKCFNKFWKENAGARSNFIQNNSSPLQITEVSAEEILKETYNPQTSLYQITLYSCALAFLVLFLCGSIYEIIRRKKRSLKVGCKKETGVNCIDLRQQATLLSESVNKNIAKLRRKQINELLVLSKLHRSKTHENSNDDETA